MTTSYVDLRAEGERAAIRSLVKGCRREHALGDRENILISKPERFREYGPALIRDEQEGFAREEQVMVEAETPKVILVLEAERYCYQAAISDLAGSDVEAHHGDYQHAVRKIRNWLAGMPGFEAIGAARVLADYEDFIVLNRSRTSASVIAASARPSRRWTPRMEASAYSMTAVSPSRVMRTSSGEAGRGRLGRIGWSSVAECTIGARCASRGTRIRESPESQSPAERSEASTTGATGSRPRCPRPRRLGAPPRHTLRVLDPVVPDPPNHYLHSTVACLRSCHESARGRARPWPMCLMLPPTSSIAKGR